MQEEPGEMKETQNIECKEVQSLCIQTVSDKALESSWVVANRNMNRERQLSGPNSYKKDLRFDLSTFFQSRRKVRWLDLCCGTGKALIQASTRFGDRLDCHGVDLVDSFAAIPQGARVTFHVASLHSWRCETPYNLITSVHGLHYIGDKLGLLERVSRWLAEDGLFLGHLDLANVSHEQHQAFGAVLGKTFKKLGIRYNTRTKILCFNGNSPLTFNYAYVGADTTAGPNYTGQDAVRSRYSNRVKGSD